MTLKNLHRPATLIAGRRDELIERWRAHVRQLPSARHLDIPTLDDHVPLATVKTFIEAHGGEVTVESEEGVGSTFRFTLPGKSAGA
ncbi:MAG: ATP-binding protein [Thiohalobacteraceae bacterium]